MTCSNYTPVPTAPAFIESDKSLGKDAIINSDVNPEKNHGYFFDPANGIYFTYTKREVKVAACRMMMRTVLILSSFALYFLLWGVCDVCILAVAAASCGSICLGMTYMTPSCVAGALAALFRGFRIGNQIAAVEIHWKM